MTTTTPAPSLDGYPNDGLLMAEIVRLYEVEPNLLDLPHVVFDCVARLADADVVTYSEFHHAMSDFRSLVSVDDMPERRAEGMAAFARHMHSHPFWQSDPDFFGDDEYMALPIAREVFLPSGARRMMCIVMQHDSYVLTITAIRVMGRAAFDDTQRDRLALFRPHLLRVYRQAQERTVARLAPVDRLRYAFPGLTARQLDVASWIAHGKSNEDIAAILSVGIDTVKAHVKAINDKLGAENRLRAAVLAHTAPPFAKLPPLWKLDIGAWGAATYRGSGGGARGTLR